MQADITPRQAMWQQFKRQRLAYYSLWLFTLLFGISLMAELISNDKPLYISYQGQSYFPLLNTYPEVTFGGDFYTPTDYLDPYIQTKLQAGDNWAIYPLNHYRFDSLNYFADYPNPAPPNPQNWLGTDDRGRDIVARLLYGFRTSVLFAFALTAIGTVLGVVIGAIQGYFAGRVDLWLQRILEIWGSMPELYLLIIFASLFEPSIWILLLILSAFSWLGLSDYMRAEFLKNRNMEYVKAAHILGLPNKTIMWRHILPNSLTPVITFLPFKLSGAIVGLTSLDYLGLGVPPSTPSLGELLAQGKDNLEAWWISLPTFCVLTLVLMLLVFIGDGLRNAMAKN